MVQALGYSVTSFNPADPGRLCRGRERWVDGFPLEEPPTLTRLVVSGATFSDDTARDARRGLPFSGLATGAVLEAVVGPGPWLAACEQGEPGDLPEGAIAEIHEVPRYGGRRIDRCARWRVGLAGAGPLDTLLAGWSPDAVLPGDPPVPPALEEALFLLTGHGERLSFPPRRYQASALPDLLSAAPWVAVFHADKHGPALAVYTQAPLPGAEDALARLAEGAGVLAVPFSIPPMLARWDRALWELRGRWPRERGDFPVPPGDDRARARETKREVVEEE